MEVAGEVGLWKGADHSSDGSKGLGTGEKVLHLSRHVKNKLSGKRWDVPCIPHCRLPTRHLLPSGHFCLVLLPAWWVQTTSTLPARARPNQITLWQRKAAEDSILRLLIQESSQAGFVPCF